MDRNFRAVLALMGVFALSGVTFAQKLPDGKGKDEIENSCVTCHAATVITRARKTPEAWTKTVNDMVGRGADVSADDIPAVVAYLAANFPADKPAAAAPVAVAPAGDADRAKGVIAGNACMACHRVEKQGMYMGPSLNGVGARRTPDEIRNAILHPSPKLHPENLFVSFTTSDGKAVSGRIVSQTEQEVRVISPTGEAGTYAKAGLKEYKTTDTNPMPPYDGRITGADLDSLTRYLSTLPAVDEK